MLMKILNIRMRESMREEQGGVYGVQARPSMSKYPKEEVNIQLFEYIEAALIWLDTHDEVANFHLLFLLNLTKHLGFYPENETVNSLFFDLKEGCFTNSIPRNNVVTGENLTYLKALLGINFEGLETLKFNGSVRQSILDVLIQYFELHLPGFKKPKSLAILKTVFE